jgi:hypothetical protein
MISSKDSCGTLSASSFAEAGALSKLSTASNAVVPFWAAVRITMPNVNAAKKKKEMKYLVTCLRK